MKIQVINYRTGTVEVIDSEEEIQPFIYKESYSKSLKVKRSTYRQDGREKNTPEEKKVHLSKV